MADRRANQTATVEALFELLFRQVENLQCKFSIGNVEVKGASARGDVVASRRLEVSLGRWASLFCHAGF